MYKYYFLICILYFINIFAQEMDTLAINNINTIESQMDSLRSIIRMLDNELQLVKQNMVEGKTDVDDLLSMLNDEDVESSNPDSRSRRKRVDALLQAITQRPGQLKFNGGATAFIQNGNSGKISHSTASGSFDIYAHTAFGSNTILFFDFEAIGGNGPNEFFHSSSGLNADAGSTQDDQGIDRLNVLEAWAEFSLLNNIFTVTAGKIDLTNYFDNNTSANDETMQFISNSFVNSAAFAVPANSPGIRLRSLVLDRLYFQVGVVSAFNSGSDIFDDLYTIAGFGYLFFPGSEFESNVRFYGFNHPAAANKTGWGLSFDKVIAGAYNIFVRYGQNEAKVAKFFGIKSAWSAGTRFVHQFAGQTAVFGLAFGMNKIGEDLNDEHISEFYIRYQINKWTHISPHFQKVWNAAGTSNQISVFGMPTHFNF